MRRVVSIINIIIVIIIIILLSSIHFFTMDSHNTKFELKFETDGRDEIVCSAIN